MEKESAEEAVAAELVSNALTEAKRLITNSATILEVSKLLPHADTSCSMEDKGNDLSQLKTISQRETHRRYPKDL